MMFQKSFWWLVLCISMLILLIIFNYQLNQFYLSKSFYQKNYNYLVVYLYIYKLNFSWLNFLERTQILILAEFFVEFSLSLFRMQINSLKLRPWNTHRFLHYHISVPAIPFPYKIFNSISHFAQRWGYRNWNTGRVRNTIGNLCVFYGLKKDWPID